MNRLLQKLSSSLLIFFILFAASCNSGGPGDDGAQFDRPAMLQNYGNNNIIPSYNALQTTVDELQNSIAVFTETSNETNLAATQEDLKEVRLAWQNASMFQFGPAESVVLRTSLNTYPADTSQVESNIDSGDYTLGSVSNQSAAGFPTMGYLLHGSGSTNQEIVAEFTTGTNAAGRKTYLKDNIDFVKDKVDAVVSEWTNNYIDTFLSDENAGTDVGSSLGQLVNALVLHYERFSRDGKIGIPAGVRSAGVPRPTSTEAFYAGYSAELAIANLEAIKRLFLGNSLTGDQGLGLDDNIEALDAPELSSQIVTELDEAIAALQQLNDPLSENIENNNDPVLTAFTEMQDIVVLLKADMASLLGITITFQDNDGD